MKTATLIYKAPEEQGDPYTIYIKHENGREYEIQWTEGVQFEAEDWMKPGTNNKIRPDEWFTAMVIFLKENYEDPRTQLPQVSSTDETD